MNGLLRFSGVEIRDPKIDIWLNKEADDLHAIAREWFEQMRRCGGDVRELMHDGCATACVGDAPFGYVGIFKAHVNVGFFCGSVLQDPARLLEGTGQNMRHVKLRPGSKVDSEALKALINGAFLIIKDRLENGD